jgi:acetylornithine/succinyldiaminopimelate/putrescine aminotransferase
VLRFLPPLVIPEHLLIEGLDILDEAFAHVAGQAASQSAGDRVVSSST